MSARAGAQQVGPIRQYLGASVGQVIFYALIGASFIVASIPSLLEPFQTLPGGLFGRIAETMRVDQFSSWVIEGMAGWRDVMVEVAETPVASYVGGAALLAVPLLLVLSLLRTFRVGSAAPLILAVLAMSAGLVAIPVLMWVVRIGQWLFQIAGTAGRWVQELLRTIQSWGWPGIVLLIGGGLLVLFLVGAGGMMLWEWLTSTERPWVKLAVSVIAVTVLSIGLVWLSRTGFWDGVGSAAAQVSAIVVVIIGVALTALFVLGLITQTGASLSGTVMSSTAFADGPRSHADVAAGVGVVSSVAVIAAAYSPEAAEWLRSATQWWPFAIDLRPILEFYESATPALHVEWISSVLDTYQPLIDAVLVVAVVTLAALSVIGGGATWRDDGKPSVWKPVFIGAALGVLAVVPLVIISGASSD